MTSSVSKEFLRWVHSLDAENLDSTQIKIINIIISNFESIAASGTAGGKRARLLSALIQKQGDTTSNSLSQYIDGTSTSSIIKMRIDVLDIGPFRGFKSREQFVFDTKYAFIYGPNGSGKSSFCEGLEYALLGEVEEAQARRIDVGEYIRNTETNSVVPPIASSRIDGKLVAIPPDDARYRFAFIEKNRIDGFARITASTAGVQKDRIATLFGLDAFSEFVDGFTENFSSYLPLEFSKAKAFEIEQRVLEQKQTLLGENQRKTKELNEEIAELIKTINVDGICSLNTIKLYLNGPDGMSGKIGHHLKMKAEPIPTDYAEILHTELFSKVVSTREAIAIIISDLGLYQVESVNVSFSNLYSALLSIGSSGDSSECPACRTPLSAVVVDPFFHAREEMEKLSALSALQQKIPKETKEMIQQLAEIKAIINKVQMIAESICFAGLSLTPITDAEFTRISEIHNWIFRIDQELESILQKENDFFKFDVAVHNQNLHLTELRKAKSTVDEDIRKYQLLNEKQIELQSKAEQLLNEKSSIETEIAEFQARNSQILEEIEIEKRSVEKYLRYEAAYTSLILNLKSYCNRLPGQLSQGLSEMVIKFYNIANMHDPDFERLSFFSIPKSPGERIVLRFIGEEAEKDALHVLSEGHIKVLGLSILLAKVVQEDLDFIVFDDVVNAIDDDHRSGIADLLLATPELQDRQQILTCHGEQFINKLEHRLGVSNASSQVTRFRFYPTDSIAERGIKVSTGDAKHYLLQARNAYSRNSLKDAASKCRQAVESVSESLWKKIANTKSVNLTVKMRLPGSPPDLSTIIDSLIKELRSIDEASQILAALSKLKDKYPWCILNKGTHEQDSLPEFERSEIDSLIGLIECVDDLVANVKFACKVIL